jgi:hypothetical protein
VDNFLRPHPTERQEYVKDHIRVPSATPLEASSACRDDDVCGTCAQYVADAQYFPCGHSYNCLSCADYMRSMDRSDFNCPLCRSEIASVAVFDAKRQRYL